jgi:hypothetical protein
MTNDQLSVSNEQLSVSNESLSLNPQLFNELLTAN